VMTAQDEDDPHAAMVSLVLRAITEADQVEHRLSLSFLDDSMEGLSLLEGPVGRALRLSKQCSESGAAKSSRGRGGGKLLDKPTTFHTRIKSSGYGSKDSVPWSLRARGGQTMGTSRPRGRGQRTGSLDKAPTRHRKETLAGVDLDDWSAPTAPQPQHTIGELHSGPICCAVFSPDGHRLATSSSDQTAHCLRLPVAKHHGDGLACTGHCARVSSVSFSSRGNLMITAADDHTARLWDTGSGETALVIDNIERNLPPRLQVTSPGRAPQTAQSSSAVSSISGVDERFGSELVGTSAAAHDHHCAWRVSTLPSAAVTLGD
jgi:hypothetical protein